MKIDGLHESRAALCCLKPVKSKYMNIGKFVIRALGVLFFALAISSCGTDPMSLPAEISSDTDSLGFSAEGGEAVIVLDATRDWDTEITYTSGDTRDWLTVTPAAGFASADQVPVTITAGANDASDREAVIVFRADVIEAEIRVVQSGAYPDYTSIEEFLAAPVNDENWYELRGTIFVIKNSNYGNIWIKDDTGILYIYGLTAAQVDRNDQSFSSLGLKVGDVVVLRTLRAEHNDQPQGGGDIPAYYISHSPAEDNPEDDILVSDDPAQDWLELPVVETADDEVFTFHHTQADGAQVRNYSMLYNTTERLALWVAYPLCGQYMATGNRTDAWGFDPKIPDAWEPVIPESWGVDGYARGHQIPSAARNANEEMNAQTFYFTNMTVQDYDFNSGIWAEVEQLERDVASGYDTLYVVTGPVLDVDGDNEWRHIYDNAGNSVAVPEGYFRVMLGVNSGSQEYDAVGFFYLNEDDGRTRPEASDLRTVAQIEELTGITFFKNLPPELASEVKSRLEPGLWGL